MIECRTFYEKKKEVRPEELLFRPSVYGFIARQDQLLVMRSKATGKWALPGGGIEKGERITEALEREIKEETDLEVAIGDFVGVSEDFFYYDPWKQAWHSLLLFYVCIPKSLSPRDVEGAAGNESATEKPQWMPVKELKATDFIPAIQDMYLQWAGTL